MTESVAYRYHVPALAPVTGHAGKSFQPRRKSSEAGPETPSWPTTAVYLAFTLSPLHLSEWTSPALADTLGFVVNSKYISVSDCL